jgi:CPA1 family monovalent cation:H+ antiporter
VRLWQIVLVVALGLACGLIEPGRFTYAFGPTTLYVFLPALLFEAAWNLDYRLILRHWLAIAALAGPGVLLTAGVVAGALCFVRVPLGAALLTGAILSATDPIAVVAVFRRLRVPKALATIVECESLFNDAVAVGFYRVVLVMLALGTVSAGALTRVVVWAVAGAAGGTLLGVAVAFIVARVLRWRSDAATQILATMLCAYGAYLAADSLGLSGIFATIACGIALRYFERASISLRIAEDVDRFWSIGAALANVVVFFMAGASVALGRLAAEPVFVLACIAAVGLARVALAEFLSLGRYPRRWIGVVRLAGMRGGLSLALALALPPATAYRDAIVDATFAVVIVTLCVGGVALELTARSVARSQTPSG